MEATKTIIYLLYLFIEKERGKKGRNKAKGGFEKRGKSMQQKLEPIRSNLYRVFSFIILVVKEDEGFNLICSTLAGWWYWCWCWC